MNSLLRGVLALSALTPILLSAQGDTAPVRKTGTIYKDEVDTLIRVVRETAARDGLPALGGESVAATAKVLSAMAHCHRFYDLNAGPAVRPSLQFLIKNRKADGSFGDQAATAWTIDALTGFDADGYRDEVAQARKWLAANGGGAEPGLQAAVAAVLEQVRADVFPQSIWRRGRRSRCGLWYDAPQSLDRGVAADALVALVACQVANRLLDKQGAQEPKGRWRVLARAAEGVRLAARAAEGRRVLGHRWGAGKSSRIRASRRSACWPADEAEGAAHRRRAGDDRPGPAWLLAQQNEDGTFGKQLPNYTTCVAVAALTRADDPAVQAGAAEGAEARSSAFQNVESSGYDASDATTARSATATASAATSATCTSRSKRCARPACRPTTRRSRRRSCSCSARRT
jgi:hypothetical protein